MEGVFGDHLVQSHVTAGFLQQLAQESVQVSSEYLQRRRLHNSLGSLFRRSVFLIANFFSHVQMELLVSLILLLHTSKQSMPHAFPLPAVTSPLPSPSLPKADQTHPVSPLILCVPAPHHLASLISAQQRGRSDASTCRPPTTFLMHPSVWLPIFSCNSALSLTFNIKSCRTPKSFLHSCSSSHHRLLTAWNTLL